MKRDSIPAREGRVIVGREEEGGGLEEGVVRFSAIIIGCSSFWLVGVVRKGEKWPFYGFWILIWGKKFVLFGVSGRFFICRNQSIGHGGLDQKTSLIFVF